MTRSCMRCRIAVKIQAHILRFFAVFFTRHLSVSRPLLLKVILSCCQTLTSESRDVVSAALEALFRASVDHECVAINTLISHGLVPALVTHVCSDDDCMRKNALFIISKMLLVNKTSTAAQVMRSSLLNHMSFVLLTNERSANQIPRIFANWIGDGAHEVQSVFDYNLLPIIVVLLNAPRDWIVLECLWVVCNLFDCGSREQIQSVLASDAYGVVASVVSMLSVWLTRAEAEPSCATAEDIVSHLFIIADLLLDVFKWLVDIDNASTKTGLAIIKKELSKEFYDSLSEQSQFYRRISDIKSRCRAEALEQTTNA